MDRFATLFITYISAAWHPAAALLDPSIKTDTEYETSLSTILRESIIDELPPELHSLAARAIPDFFVKVGTDQDRSAYVIQLADGAFNFYTLEVPEDLAKRLQAQLKELTIFLDTNFLFGILDLHLQFSGAGFSRPPVRYLRKQHPFQASIP